MTALLAFQGWRWTANGSLPSTVSETLEKIRADGVQLLYPNIASIFGIVLTFAATSAGVERIKTYRSTMCEERFNALVLLFVHRDIALEYDKIIDMYAQRYPRVDECYSKIRSCSDK